VFEHTILTGVYQLVSTIEFKRPSPLRNCFRCGLEFRRERGNRICPSCRSPQAGKRPLNPKLSFRERQVVNLVSQAKLNKEIAYELHLTEGTIKEYLNRIFRKLGMTNRTELAVWALTHQTLEADEHVA
jgi:DNA-binding NarL/FixJ family response regulator